MNGIHDMGGMHGFGRVEVEVNEPVFHAPWQGRVLGMVFQFVGGGWSNVDAFRHAIERVDPVSYLSVGYYGRWIRALERLVAETGATTGTATPSAASAGIGVIRTIETGPRFAVGQAVRARNLQPAGHTRLPRYVRGKRGTIHRIHPACVFPDTHAHGEGEKPQHVYSVRFSGRELWGADAEPATALHIDLFDDYLEPA
jgi:nitrile hydratase